MGIQGLLPVLKSITSTIHVSKYAGSRIAIDGYSWLHKGAYSCARELCEGVPTDKYISFCLERIRLLRSCGITPVMVFDGGRLPMKALEEASRARSRKEHRDRALAHLQAGNVGAANECFQRAVDISPATAKRLIEVLKREGIDYLVAPYEADAQLAYLALSGDVDAVITEDSDLLAYGCPKVLFKMDKSGECQEVALTDLSTNREMNLVGFTPQMFLEMCIMAGCDFVKALPGIGMKKAHQHIRRLRSFVRVSKSLRFTCSVPRTYEEDVQRAIWTFRHQRVFCPRTRTLVHLRPLPELGLAATAAVSSALDPDDEKMAFLGPPLPDDIVCQIAAAELDPITLRRFPASVTAPAHHGSGGFAHSHHMPQLNGSGEEFQRNGIMNYFLPHARVSQRASRAFKAPGKAAPGSGGLLKPAEQPAAVASTHVEGCQSQPESSASDIDHLRGQGTAIRHRQDGAVSSNARPAAVRGTLPRIFSSSRRPDSNAARLRTEQPQSDDDAASPARPHPLAGNWRRQSQQTVWLTQWAAQQRHTGEPTAADGGSRVLQELRNCGSSPRRPAAQSASSNSQSNSAAAAESHQQAADADASKQPSPIGSFGDLKHMRQYAVEASKALDSLKRSCTTLQKPLSAAGSPPAIAAQQDGVAAATSSLKPRGTPAQCKAQAAAREAIERFKRQLPRPPGHTPRKAARQAASTVTAAGASAGTAAQQMTASKDRLHAEDAEPGQFRQDSAASPLRAAGGLFSSSNPADGLFDATEPADNMLLTGLPDASPSAGMVPESPAFLRRRRLGDTPASPSTLLRSRHSPAAVSDPLSSSYRTARPLRTRTSLPPPPRFDLSGGGDSSCPGACLSDPDEPTCSMVAVLQHEQLASLAAQDRLFGRPRLRALTSEASSMLDGDGCTGSDGVIALDGSDPVEAFSWTPARMVRRSSLGPDIPLGARMTSPMLPSAEGPLVDQHAAAAQALESRLFADGGRAAQAMGADINGQLDSPEYRLPPALQQVTAEHSPTSAFFTLAATASSPLDLSPAATTIAGTPFSNRCDAEEADSLGLTTREQLPEHLVLQVQDQTAVELQAQPVANSTAAFIADLQQLQHDAELALPPAALMSHSVIPESPLQLPGSRNSLRSHMQADLRSMCDRSDHSGSHSGQQDATWRMEQDAGRQAGSILQTLPGAEDELAAQMDGAAAVSHEAAQPAAGHTSMSHPAANCFGRFAYGKGSLRLMSTY